MSKTVTAPAVQRDARDALAESVRLEAIGASAHPSWADWWEEGREPVRRRADQIIRMLRQRGFDVVPTGEDTPAPASMSDIIYSYPMEGANTVRAIRVDRATKQWQVVQFENGQEQIEISFKLADAIEYAGLVLIGSTIPLKVPRVGLILAALAEINRVYATAMTGEEAVPPNERRRPDIFLQIREAAWLCDTALRAVGLLAPEKETTMGDWDQIPRGADLTDEDLAILAEDARVVSLWSARHQLKKPAQIEQTKAAFEARLGRRPLVLPEGDS